MSGTYQVTMGDYGRLVIPAELRERAGLAEGMSLILLEAPHGLVLLTRPQLQELVRADLAGSDLVGELLAGRRAESAAEDGAWTFRFAGAGGSRSPASSGTMDVCLTIATCDDSSLSFEINE